LVVIGLIVVGVDFQENKLAFFFLVIDQKVLLLLKTRARPNTSWKEYFLSTIRNSFRACIQFNHLQYR